MAAESLRADPLRRLLEHVRAGCERELERLRAEGLATPVLQGQLIRPLLAYSGASSAGDERLWRAALAVQLAHEASLLHDDVIDAAVRRRGQPTVAASRGTAAALVEGDHLLTTGYRLAARTGSLAFVDLYARAVERTVAGERLQHARRGERLTMEEYRAIVLGKSGELIGCAFAAAPVLRGHPAGAAYFELGRTIGLCYQMVDDLLDYCVGAQTGKTAFADWSQRLWTWPLQHLPEGTWPADEAALRTVLAQRDASGRTPLENALVELRAEFARTRAEVERLLPDDRAVGALLDQWLMRAELGVAATTALLSDGAPEPASPPDPRLVLPPAGQLDGFFARNSRSFSFAARLFPPAERRRIADVYAFCRVTDDLVDDAAPVAEKERRLDAWAELCARAYQRGDTGIATLDRVLQAASRDGVPFTYVEELIAGMRMDLTRRGYESLAELRTYTYRVASVVGLWLTRTWGVHDGAVLERAADLGHAMQLTNIVRDVGEDLRAGRVYLPRDLMHAHRVDESLLLRMQAGEPAPARYRALVETLMAVADTYYARAFAAIPSLPAYARAPVAVAAAVYRGIHDEVRANRYDNVRRRARTTTARKFALALGALWRLHRPTTGGLALRRLRRAAIVTVALLLAFAAGARAQPKTLQHLQQIESRIAAEPEDSLLRLERLRAIYFVGVDHEPHVRQASIALAEVRRDYPGLAHARAPLLQAYEGALELLRAKHGSWPIARWKATRRGLHMLDAAVTAAPRDAEVRYLRLISCFYLPGFFGRGDSVREDFTVLATLLPGAGDHYPLPFVRQVARFVLEHAELDPAVRLRLQTWVGSDE